MPAFGLTPASYRAKGVVVLLVVLAGGPVLLSWRFANILIDPAPCKRYPLVYGSSHSACSGDDRERNHPIGR